MFEKKKMILLKLNECQIYTDRRACINALNAAVVMVVVSVFHCLACSIHTNARTHNKSQSFHFSYFQYQ